MISLAEARSAVADDWSLIAVDAGSDVHPAARGVGGPATALVRPLPDALKLVSNSGLIRGPADREAVWSVESLVISRAVLHRIGDEFDSLADLYRAVDGAGFDWSVSVMPSGP